MPRKAKTAADKFILRPTDIARYFYHECERQLRYFATPGHLRDSSGVPDLDEKPSVTYEALLKSGYKWEATVVGKHLKGKVRVAKGKRGGRIYDRTFGVEDTLTQISKLKPGTFIYQPTLEVPNRFLEKIGIDDTLATFAKCRPDLIEMKAEDGSEPELRVIDIKASDMLRATHRVQVYLYTLILREVLKSEGIDVRVSMTSGGIWLSQSSDPESFELGPSARALDAFFAGPVNEILKAPLEQVPWHLYYRCEWCPYFAHCHEEAVESNSVSLFPYLSVAARRYLREAPWESGRSIHTMKALERLSKRKDAAGIFDACGSLRIRSGRIKTTLKAISTGKTLKHGCASVAMPCGESVTLVLTLQSDPISGKIYACGFRRSKGKDIFSKGARQEVFVAGSPEEIPGIHKAFLKSLRDELEILDKYNADRHDEWRDQKSLQTYVFDSYEAQLFNDLLLESVGDPNLSALALQMLFYYQDPGLVHADEHPRQEVPYPIVVLSQVINAMLALPYTLALRLQDASEALESPVFTFKYRPSDLFTFEMSNRMKSDAIMLAWNDGREEAAGWIAKELGKRLLATGALVEGVRTNVRDYLFAWPPKFRFPDRLDFQRSILSKLAFFVRYESVFSAIKTREERARPFSERERDEISIRLKCLGDGRWKVLSEVAGGKLKVGTFLRYLIVPEGEGGDRAQMSYNDYRYRSTLFSPRGPVNLAAIVNMEETSDGFVSHMHIGINYSKDSERFKRGDLAVLHHRFMDFNSDRLVAHLEQIDNRPEHEFIHLVEDPISYSRKLTVKKPHRDAALRLVKRARFTNSQLDAFQRVLNHRLSLIWGPPGTGKTYFLAGTIAALAASGAETKRALRIGVTAFTHAAVENLLRMTSETLDRVAPKRGIPVYKLDGTRTQRGEGLDTLQAGSANLQDDKPQIVIGGTVYALHKATDRGMMPFDIIVVDEASQMKLPELALGLIAKRKEGRLVLAGDDLQLPPIIRATYPEHDRDSPELHGSAFAYLRALDSAAESYTRQLYENWRMNSTLTEFPAIELYGTDFRPATKKIANRKARLAPPVSKSKRKASFAEWVADPSYPLVLCVLDGIRATIENPAEARLVAELSVFFRRRLLKRDKGKHYPKSSQGDAEFWKEGLFIVSPHHVQIRSIMHHLQKSYTWKSRPFVDTVDKMQGQECEVVIVSYGVSDVETALAESEFIYGLNRLNVAITRARSKCVVFLSNTLLTPAANLLENDKVAEGFSFMRSLLDFCQSHGEEREFPIDRRRKDRRIIAIRARAWPKNSDP